MRNDDTEYLRHAAASEELAAAQIKRQMAQEELERFRTSSGDERTLRDWFAGQALQGNLACSDAVWKGYPHDIVADCYRLADAMMAERKKG